MTTAATTTIIIALSALILWRAIAAVRNANAALHRARTADPMSCPDYVFRGHCSCSRNCGA